MTSIPFPHRPARLMAPCAAREDWQDGGLPLIELAFQEPPELGHLDGLQSSVEAALSPREGDWALRVGRILSQFK